MICLPLSFCGTQTDILYVMNSYFLKHKSIFLLKYVLLFSKCRFYLLFNVVYTVHEMKSG